MKISEIVEMAMPSTSIKSKRYYHGTSSDRAAKLIMQNGIDPGDIAMPERFAKKQRGPNLLPVIGKVYITSDIAYALIYALGGNIAGTDYIPKGRKYGYLFVIDGDSLTDIQPDEDSVGDLIRLNLLSKDSTWRTLVLHSKKLLTTNQWNKFVAHNNDEFSDMYIFAHLGKKILPQLSDSQKLFLIDQGAHIAHTGKLIPSAAYRINLSNIEKLNQDGSNFFEYAEKLK